MNIAININQALATQQDIQITKTVRENRPRLLNFIRRRVRTEEDAEDVLQDVLAQFVSGFDSIESIEKVSSWLFRVARNKITDLFRKKKPLTFSDVEKGGTGDEEENAPSLGDILPDLSNSPDVMMTRSIIWEAIEEALEELPEEQREVFTMHEFDGKSFKEISKITGHSVNTLLSRKRYAVLFLREALQDLYFDLNT